MQTNIHILKVSKEESEKGVEKIFEEIIVKKSFLNLMKDVNLHIQKICELQTG
jgi:hypothetical protein